VSSSDRETAGDILARFLERLRGADWTRATALQKASVVNWTKEHLTLVPDLGTHVAKHMGIPEFDMELLLAMSPADVLTSFEWAALKDMGPGSNVPVGRTWDVFPRDGFFGDYLEYTLNSEAPIEFHFFTAATILGVVAKRNFVFYLGHSDIFPNLWTVLVAESGICRKTSAINIGKRLLDHVKGVNFITTSTTPEFLVEQLKAEVDGTTYDEGKDQVDFHFTASQGFIVAPELPVFLGKQQYNEGLIQRLTDLSDNPRDWSAGTRREKREELKNVSLSLEGGITPESLRTAIPRTAHGGGFMSRILWISKETTPRRIPLPPPPSPLLKAKLLDHLDRISRADPAILTCTRETAAWFAEWYNGLRDSVEGTQRKVQGYLERKPANLWRLAALLVLGQTKHEIREVEGRRECNVPLECLKWSDQVLQDIEEPLYQTVSQVDATATGEALERVRRSLYRLTQKSLLRRVGHSDLLRSVSMYMNTKELHGHLQTLQASHEVVTEEALKAGHTVTFYKLGPKFRSRS